MSNTVTTVTERVKVNIATNGIWVHIFYSVIDILFKKILDWIKKKHNLRRKSFIWYLGLISVYMYMLVFRELLINKSFDV